MLPALCENIFVIFDSGQIRLFIVAIGENPGPADRKPVNLHSHFCKEGDIFFISVVFVTPESERIYSCLFTTLAGLILLICHLFILPAVFLFTGKFRILRLAVLCVQPLSAFIPAAFYLRRSGSSAP